MKNKLEVRQGKQINFHDNHSGPEKSTITPGQSCHFRMVKGAWIELKVVTSCLIKYAQGLRFRRNHKDICLSTNIPQLKQPIQAHIILKEHVGIEP